MCRLGKYLVAKIGGEPRRASPLKGETKIEHSELRQYSEILKHVRHKNGTKNIECFIKRRDAFLKPLQRDLIDEAKKNAINVSHC